MFKCLQKHGVLLPKGLSSEVLELCPDHARHKTDSVESVTQEFSLITFLHKVICALKIVKQMPEFINEYCSRLSLIGLKFL